MLSDESETIIFTVSPVDVSEVDLQACSIPPEVEVDSSTG